MINKVKTSLVDATVHQKKRKFGGYLNYILAK